jgi:hypothetical protein
MSKGTNNFNFAGLNGFVWWMGQIENRGDAAGLSRYQVRIFGWYGEEIPTSDLPWAIPLFSINTCKTFESAPIGEWVIGFFLDGEAGQSPVILGVMPGITQLQSELTNIQVQG